MNDTPSKRFGWKPIVVVCAVLFVLWGLIAPAIQPVRESGPHPKRHRHALDVVVESFEAGQ